MNNDQNRQPNHLTNSLIMVRPVDFGYNEQTGIDNEFQNKPKQGEKSQITKLAISEFDASVKILTEKGIEILQLEKKHTNNRLPDAIFPNNWFSTQTNGNLIIYPMKTKNRKDEVQIEYLTQLLTDQGYKASPLTDLRGSIGKIGVLEGTGSIVFHHPSQRLFAALSERCEQQAVDKFASQFGYKLIKFNTQTLSGNPVYHTNVIMSCGQDFTVITQDIIQSDQKQFVIDELYNCVNQIILINERQMTNNFCGNILQVKNKNHEPVIVMSNSAYQGFTNPQLKLLEQHGDIAIINIPTIERIGGGSARCMLAENFLPQ